MRVNAWNIYSTIRDNARLVCGTDHGETTVTAALDQAEVWAQNWNAVEERPDMLVTMLSCNGYVRSVPTQASLF